MSDWNQLLPQPSELAALLRLNPTPEAETLFEDALLRPITAFLNRKSKRFRSQILEFAFAVADEGRTPELVAADLCSKGAFIVESIHAASMVVDDIEDQSLERRGDPSLHRQVGLPIALNAGNWLYFWPLERLKSWNLEPQLENRVYRVVIEAVVHAHFGQALDLGVPIDSLAQEKVWETCLASLELKTGALMGLAAGLGGVLAKADEKTVETLKDFGLAFGVALQMFDDIGNLSSRTPTPDPKQYEDLRLRRPSWVWACAANFSSPSEFALFREAVSRLPDNGPLESWLDAQALRTRARSLALESLDRAFAPLETGLTKGSHGQWIRELAEKLRSAYA